MGHPMELAHFTVGAGEVYYFLGRVIPTPYGVYLFLDPVDSDQAKFLIASYPPSVVNPRK
jgi:hypothetical protein